jgi:hypothetical protein
MSNVYSFKTCINCGLVKRSNGIKYCSLKCQNDFQYKEKVNKWLNGEISGVRGGIATCVWIKRYLLSIRGHKCENCKNDSWMNLPITLEMDHVDGNYLNNNPKNLKLLCPNCHSITPNFKSKNRLGRKKRNDLLKKNSKLKVDCI